MNREAIDLLIQSNRYNVEILGQLENWVKHQTENNTNHLDANLTVLKFYQFHPEKTDKHVVGNILAKGLMNLPHNDFQLYMYLVNEKLHDEDPVRCLVSLSHLLETAQFTEFWKETTKCKEVLSKISGFDEAIRNFVIEVVSMTYKTIPKGYLSDMLNLKGSELDTLVTSKGWTPGADSVSFPQSDQSKQKKTQETFKHSDLAKLLANVA